MKIDNKIITKLNKCSNKYAIITGGTGRIGGIFINLLLNSGCKVISLSRRKNEFNTFKKDLSPKLQKKLSWYSFDITKNESINKLVSFINKKNIKVDLLINNAAPSARGEDFKYNENFLLNEFMGVLGGSILLTEKLLPIIRKNKFSKIINVGSVWGIKAQRRKVYLEMDIGPSIMTSAGKSGILNFTKFLAAREAKFGITVNSLIPGWFPRPGPVQREDYISNICSNIPLGRIGKIDDLISPISFLLSDGSKYYTGQSLIVDGGSTIW
tara:strand:+ start:810 stop:1616 length:807 start_codon:yes stop_codon:yes gene_type:complete